MPTQSAYVHLQPGQFLTNNQPRTSNQVASQVRGAPRKTQFARNITALPCSGGSFGQSRETTRDEWFALSRQHPARTKWHNMA